MPFTFSFKRHTPISSKPLFNTVPIVSHITFKSTFKSSLISILLATLLTFSYTSSDTEQHCTPEIISASYSQPTQRYAHAVLGDDIEYGALEVVTRATTAAGANCKTETFEAVLPTSLVFEDLQPRLVDLTGDGKPEIISVESSQRAGARLTVWGITDAGLNRITATPFIGTAYRWLAPIGAADLDQDGKIEIAYIDRPHLAKTLRVWRYNHGQLEPVANYNGLSNHRIGEDFISGGIRDCGQGPEMVTVDAYWSKIMATTLRDGKLTTKAIGSYHGPGSLERTLSCK